MKTKTTLLRACMIMAMVFAGYYTQAQQSQIVKPLHGTGQLPGKETVADFTYKIFQAPNKMYGYDIFHDGKIIFHQGASPLQSNNSVEALSKKEQADKAALLAIEKIKKNQPATLTQEEFKTITIK